MERLGAAIDRRLAELILLRARRRWQMLSLVPVSWILPILAPAASRLRRSLCRGALVAAVSTGVMIVVIVRYT